MWRLIRPDAARALEDPLVNKILPRYVGIIKNDVVANFQICKKIPFEFDKSMTDEQLWGEHEKLIKKYKLLKKKLDSGKADVNSLENPRYSLIDLKMFLTESILRSCELCERKCDINRLNGEKGECGVGKICLISSDFTHLGEEFFISPSHTIFFMGCNFHCQYCQNWGISQWYEAGYPVTDKILARRIEEKKKQGCRNVNFVGGEPTPNLLWILKALKLTHANQAVVWNSNFYMSEKTMKLLEGVVDVYLSDFKYGNDQCALRLSKVPNYFDVVTRNHLIAAKQAELVIRHLVLPNHLECCSKPILEWISKNVRNSCIVNIMDQYRPEFKATEHKDINRRLTTEEFEQVVFLAKRLKLNFIT
jgi:putative pyruvate formate lyase activating enzyme